MARRTILADDLDGSEDDVSNVSFSIDGSRYEIDLSSDNRARLGEALARFIEAGRSVGESGEKRTRAAAPTSAPRRHVVTDVDPRAVRAWAASQGIAVSGRGRIAAGIVEQFRAAGN